MAVALQGLKALVVEDEPLLALTYRDPLTDCGAEVVGPFMTLADASVAIDQCAVDVAIVDFALRDATAADLERTLEQRGFPYIVVTGYPKGLVRRHPSQVVYNKPISNQLLCPLVAATASDLHISKSV